MTLVHVDLRHADGTPVRGVLDFEPTMRREEGDHILLPSPIRVGLVDGVVDVDLDPTTNDWVWRVEEHVPYGAIRYVIVPEVGPVDYTDLVDVDPESLEPGAEPDPIWEADLDALTARVAAVEAENEAQADEIDALDARVALLEGGDDGFVLGTTEPSGGVNVGSGVGGRPVPVAVIEEGPGITAGADQSWQIGPGVEVSDVVIPGRVILSEGARLYNCTVTGPSTEVLSGTAMIRGPGEGVQARVEFCTVDPSVPSPYYDGVQDGLVIQRSWVKNVTDGVRAYNSETGLCRIRMEGSLVEALTQFTPDYAFPGERPETHNDCAQMQGNPSGDLQDLFFDGCKFNARHSTTKGDVAELHRAEISALMLSPNVGSIHVTFQRGWLLGGIFCVNAGNDGLAGSELTVTDCRFERPGTDPLAPDVAFAVDSSLTLVESGNVFIDNGEPVPLTGA